MSSSKSCWGESTSAGQCWKPLEKSILVFMPRGLQSTQSTNKHMNGDRLSPSRRHHISSQATSLFKIPRNKSLSAPGVSYLVAEGQYGIKQDICKATASKSPCTSHKHLLPRQPARPLRTNAPLPSAESFRRHTKWVK